MWSLHSIHSNETELNIMKKKIELCFECKNFPPLPYDEQRQTKLTRSLIKCVASFKYQQFLVFCVC